MSVGTWVAGGFLGQVAPWSEDGGADYADLGVCGGRGFGLDYTAFSEVIRDTDQFGDTPLDTIDRGSEYRIQFELLEVNEESMTVLNNEQAGFGGILSMGMRGTDIASELLLTALVGPPAETVMITDGSTTAGPAFLHALRFKILEGRAMRMALSDDHRRIPIFGRLLWEPLGTSGPFDIYCFDVGP